MKKEQASNLVSRRTLLKGAAAAATAPMLAACIGQQSPGPGGGVSAAPSAAASIGARPKLSGNLNILQWSHFVPDFDTYLDGWAKKWGDTNGVKVTIDRIPQADLPARFAAEVSAKSGHDLVAHFAAFQDRDARRKAMAHLRRDGRRFSAAGACSNSGQSPRLRHELARSG